MKKYTWRILRNTQVSRSTHHYGIRIRPFAIGGYFTVDFDVVMPYKNGLRNFEYDFSHLPEIRNSKEVQESLIKDIMADLIWSLKDCQRLSTESSYKDHDNFEELCGGVWNWDWVWHPKDTYLDDYVRPKSKSEILQEYL